MPKVKISSPEFTTEVLDEAADSVILFTKDVYRSVDGFSPIMISSSDELMNTMVEISDSTYGTTFKRFEAEEDVALTTRKDFVNDTVLYKGEALPGTLESEPSWRISKLTFINAEGDIKEEFAEGSAEFTKTWDDRTLYEYV